MSPSKLLVCVNRLLVVDPHAYVLKKSDWSSRIFNILSILFRLILQSDLGALRGKLIAIAVGRSLGNVYKDNV